MARYLVIRTNRNTGFNFICYIPTSRSQEHRSTGNPRIAVEQASHLNEAYGDTYLYTIVKATIAEAQQRGYQLKEEV